MKKESTIEVWCDVGGTFTDCIVLLPSGVQRTIKVLSHGIIPCAILHKDSEKQMSLLGRDSDRDGFWTSARLTAIDKDGNRLADSTCIEFCQGRFQLDRPLPESTHRVEIHTGLEAPVLATRMILQIPLSNPLPPLSVRLGTTRGTNALLTRTGERVVFVTTEGFSDLLEIGFQERPDLFDLNVRKRRPLYDCVVEVSERLAADGSVLKPLDEQQARGILQPLFQQGYRSLAICLIHSYVNSVHEQKLEAIAKEIGFEFIASSQAIAPMIKAVSRGETSVVDAYITPVVKQYLDRVKAQFGSSKESEMLVMTSAGGLVPANRYRGKDSVLSGPAGGVVSLQALAKATGVSPFIGLDMGGTSTDVSRVDGDLDVEFETVKAGVRMMIPSLKIHTVAAGGGSVCWFDGVQLRVGPQSAGSNPGPACYGRGGPLTVTDLNLLAGRIDSHSFPFPLNRNAAHVALAEVLDQLNLGKPNDARMSHQSLIDGFRRIANESMANAVRSVSLSQGVDPRTHTLVAFGGAAGQHICEIANILGIQQIIDPPAAGLFSALGMGMAQIQYTASLAVYQSTENLDVDWYRESIRQLTEQLLAQSPDSSVHNWGPVQVRIEARYVGADGSIPLPWSLTDWDPLLVVAEFHKAHRLRFGYDRMNRDVEVTLIHGILRSLPTNQLEHAPIPSRVEPQSASEVCDRNDLIIGGVYPGPRLIRSEGSTTYVDKNWRAVVLSDKTLCLRAESRMDSAQDHDHSRFDPVLRDVLAKRFAAIAEQMGTVLEQTAISVNVKERRDFSCAVFNASGDLIANAPHVPVHLGAMSATVKQMMLEFAEMRPGDCFITNDPFRGGSHLPDVTVVTPVFADKSQPSNVADFFVACRAHHAEIGGIAPGSMAPNSRCLTDEGVLIPPMHLARAGVDCTHQVEKRLTDAKYPTRALRENLADIAAQQASNQFGIRALEELATTYGLSLVQQYMEHIQQASQQKTERWISTLPFEEQSYQDFMDDGTTIALTVRKVCTTKGQYRLQIDFTGTGPESKGNLNANPAIVSAAVLYVVRCAIADDLPLNSGVLRCIDLSIPPGILNPQRGNGFGVNDATSIDEGEWPAVAGGNVETSQRIVDCLLGAFGLAACSQGTMNNFLFGDGTFGYYETICGGAGATSSMNGENAVHTHMTNTRLTDVEVLEKRYPVRLTEFRVRKGSGGNGRFQGGCGIVRQVQALRPLTVSLVTSRRAAYPPRGLHGGQSGSIGENWHILQSGVMIRLPSSTQMELKTGESIRLLTPGGGGYGHEGEP